MKNRSLIDNILYVEFVMESAVIVGARRAGTVCVRHIRSFPIGGVRVAHAGTGTSGHAELG